MRLPDAHAVLCAGLVVSAVVPVLSGFVLALDPRLYTRAVAPGVVDNASDFLWHWIDTWMRLHGTSSVVAGVARIAVALVPATVQSRWLPASFGLHRVVGLAALAQAVLELWLLPSAVPWVERFEHQAKVTLTFHVLIWEFVAVHIVVALMLMFGLLGPNRAPVATGGKLLVKVE